MILLIMFLVIKNHNNTTNNNIQNIDYIGFKSLNTIIIIIDTIVKPIIIKDNIGELLLLGILLVSNVSIVLKFSKRGRKNI